MTTLGYLDSTSLGKQPSGGESAGQTELRETPPSTVLLAEDDAAVRDFIQAILEQAGYAVLVAENGRKALALCENDSGRINALITDIVMPEVNGRELAEQARRKRPDLKVLFISGSVDRGPKQYLVGDSAGNAFLEKPFTSESLLAILAGLSVPPRLAK
jgi:CheY-like chemotaxis protein